MRLTFVGTSHGVPEPYRRCSSMMFEAGGKYYFVDMGTQSIEDVIRMGISPEDVRLIICTHPHGDHTNGVISFVDLCCWYFRKANPTVLLPNEKLVDVMKMWLEANGTQVRPEIPMSRYDAGVAYEDENIKVTAIDTKHCPDSHAFIIEADGKRVLVTGDLSGTAEDFPEEAYEGQLDLIVCECAHFSPLKIIPMFDKTNAERVIISHISPAWKADLAKVESTEHKYTYREANDGMVVEI